MQADTGQSPDHSLLTIAELAKRFDLPESTARFYCKRFRAFLPHVGAGKRRRYLPETLEVFSVLLAEMEERKNASAVEAALEDRFPRQEGVAPADGSMDAPAAAQPQALAQLMRTQSKALQDIAQALSRLAPMGQAAASPGQSPQAMQDPEAVQRLETRIAELELEVANLRRLQDESERIHQQDLEQLRKWLNHLAQEQRQAKGQG